MKHILLFLFLLIINCSTAESSRKVSASGDPEDIFFEKEESAQLEDNSESVESPKAAVVPEKQQNAEERVAAAEPQTAEKNDELSSENSTEENDFDQVGFSSWYGQRFQGNKTASGEIFDKNELTAAHPTFPLGSYAKIYNFDNKKEIIVKINDRGPYSGNRILDVSEKAADALNFKHSGVAKVGIKLVKKEDIPKDQPEEESVIDDEELELTAAIQDEKEIEPPAAVKPQEEKTTLKKPAVVPAMKGLYFIQLGIFTEKERAESVKAEMQKVYKEPVNIVKKDGKFVVRLGNFNLRKDAEALRDKMKEEGIDCFIPLK